jgi:hypothetical protein
MADPLITRDQLKASADKDQYVQGVVDVTLQEVIEEDHYGFEKLLAGRLIGEDLQEKLLDMSYAIVSHTSKALAMNVRGSIKMWLRDQNPTSEKDE